MTGIIDDEPEHGAETVLTIRLTIANDLEPSWSLVSARAEAQGQTRNLTWGDRVRLAPARIGVLADYHLGWGRGSVLNRISEERADTAAALAKAARDARTAFGDEVQDQLGETLGIVETTAKELGIFVGENVKAMLDAYSVSFSGGTISLHNEEGVPLRGLGIGSTRLLITGLQRKATGQAKTVLIDELEYGLEPHRIIRLLGSLGAKEQTPPLQVFMTTHSPVVLRELSGEQLFVLRPTDSEHKLQQVGIKDDIQSTIRLFPDAFLAPQVIICEGASEVGLVRGMDQFFAAKGGTPIGAKGVALVDCGGGDKDRSLKRAAAFKILGYRTVIIRDDDIQPTPSVEQLYAGSGGKVIKWRNGRTLEDELFLSLSDDGVHKLIAHAIALHGEDIINDHIKSISQNTVDLDTILVELLAGAISPQNRVFLGKASRTKRNGWFKSVTWMEDAARDIVGPDLENADSALKALINSIFVWANNAAS